MNIARKLVKELKEELRLKRITGSENCDENIYKIIAELEYWIEYHEKIFDHTNFRGTHEEISAWLAYHNDVMLGVKTH